MSQHHTLNAPITTVKRARRLRKTMSLPEVLLSRELRKRPGGFKFRPQYPLSQIVLDFACLSARLAIEIDGEAHNRGDSPERDERRDGFIRSAGFEVMRIPAVDVLKNLDVVVTGIVEACRARGPLHHSPEEANGPPPRSGEELGEDPPRNGEVARSAGGGPVRPRYPREPNWEA